MELYPRPPGGGRHCARSVSHDLPHFYPRPPGGGRLMQLSTVKREERISIHALRVEGDGGVG